jgi:hypothetical protein
MTATLDLSGALAPLRARVHFDAQAKRARSSAKP